jgi:uncharacterized protein YbaR (Trm112 family)
MSLIDPSLAAVLVCTVDKADLVEDVESQRLVCTECGRRYPVRDGIPTMLVEAAEGGPDD